ncbi:SusC/RagA family TonB-linked outer membrane protein [Zobellia galactanivorans]|uniref:SusC/RagA family TonB-linked outer membrane protein n=1 Tax=Zobellia galactanivorans (strain DSM 12802 / CCUG 47099 / CIP 106680 / NCIMB 13871 / Dsij) TaxID=63186 RepID=UPI001C07ED2F|nr:TonB-dependent receptor [Zobellia galactanivorans]MBU3025926.1 TonB-dependent receptor [Zobellia galactanivorans]
MQKLPLKFKFDKLLKPSLTLVLSVMVVLPSGISYASDSKINSTILNYEPLNTFVERPNLQKEVSGVVLDTNGQPLSGATISEKGTLNGVIADFDGKFSISVTDENAVLVVSYIGFASKEIAVNGKESIQITLEEAAAGLDEVVVIGYGTVKKSDLTGAVSSIKAEDLNTDSQASIDEIIQGRISGVQVTQTSAEPGGAFSIRIRGTNSITAGNEPLYVIDGLPGANPGNSLNPADVKSIEVLKDASATAIYGARGSNGVVLITTKQGLKNSKLEINYNLSTGIQSASKTLDLLNTQEYITFYNDLSLDRGVEAPFSQEYIDNIGLGTDWQKEVLQTALMQEHRLSFSGGSEDTQYYLSLNYFNQEGIVIDSGFERFTGRVNLTHSIGDKLKVGINLSNSLLNEDLIPSGTGTNRDAGVIATALQLPPTLPVYDANGDYSLSLQDLSNSVAQAKTIEQFTKSTRIYGNTFIDYQVSKNFNSRINLGYDHTISEGDEVLNKETQRGILFEGRATRSSTENNSYLFEFINEYSKDFSEKHKFKALAGYSYQKFQNSRFSASAQNFPSTSFGSNNLGAGDPSQYSVSSSKDENTIISGFGRLNYNYDDRYLLTGSIRADGSSRFGENNKVAYFPSAALGWNVSNESFYSDESVVSNLKLRASYGLSGNQEINNARSLVLLGSGPIAVLDGNEVQSIAPIQLENPYLKWETTESLNFGLDYGILNGRVTGSFEYFINKTRDLLLDLPVPTTTGFASSLQNVGDTRNSGFELNISSNNFIGEFAWTTDFNFSTVKNEVLNLGELPRVLQGNTRFVQEFTILEVGQPINSYYGYVFDGVFQSQDEIDSTPSQANAAPGSRKFKDLNDDGLIDDEDRTVLGDPFPDFTFGLNNNFNYKGISLDVFLEGKIGFELANFTNIDSDNPIDNLRNRQTYVLDRWTPENPSNETPSFVSPSRTYDFNSRIVEDASFVQIKNARLGYSFPNLKIKRISSLLVYVSGQNLAMFTNYKGYNPNVNALGSSNVRIDYNAYPLARIYSIGINVKF